MVVTVLLRHCYGIVTVLLRYCYGIVTVLLRYCYGTVTVLLRHCYGIAKSEDGVYVWLKNFFVCGKGSERHTYNPLPSMVGWGVGQGGIILFWQEQHYDITICCRMLLEIA